MTIVRDFAQKATAATSAGITLGTVAATTSGTAVDFTGIPTTAERITVMFRGVSTSATSVILIRIGAASSPAASGYTTVAAMGATTTNTGLGFPIVGGANTAAGVWTGAVTLTLSDVTNNIWTATGILLFGTAANVPHIMTGTSPALAGKLNIVRITTTNGIDTFDAGSVNIAWD